MKKTISIIILIILISISQSRKKKIGVEVTEEMKNKCAVEEMNMRARGTFIINYVDQFDRIGVYNKTSPDVNGDENRDDVEDLQPDSVGRRKLKRKKQVLQLSELSSHNKDVKKATDKYLAEAIKLMGNRRDIRRINIFNTKKLEIPVLCKKTLDEEEMVKMSQKATNMSFCWINASGSDNFGKFTYLDLPYLNPEEFAEFYICATKRSGNNAKQTSTTFNDATNANMVDKEDEASNKYITIEQITKYPEALYQFVMGRHPVGMPISWLRFMIYICQEGGTYDKNLYIAQEGDKDYNAELTDDYKDKLTKQIAICKKQTQKRLDDRQTSMIYSGLRFSKKHRHQQFITDKVVRFKTGKKYEKKLNKAGIKLDSRILILNSVFEKFIRKMEKKDRRLKKVNHEQLKTTSHQQLKKMVQQKTTSHQQLKKMVQQKKVNHEQLKKHKK